jgi:hypothetical protein
MRAVTQLTAAQACDGAQGQRGVSSDGERTQSHASVPVLVCSNQPRDQSVPKRPKKMKVLGLLRSDLSPPGHRWHSLGPHRRSCSCTQRDWKWHVANLRLVATLCALGREMRGLLGWIGPACISRQGGHPVLCARARAVRSHGAADPPERAGLLANLRSASPQENAQTEDQSVDCASAERCTCRNVWYATSSPE